MGVLGARRPLLAAVVVALLAGAVASAPAPAAQQIGLGTRHVRLEVDGHGRALVTYVHRGVRRRVLARGAINAVRPRRYAEQRHFRVRHQPPGWRRFHNRCRPYEGPRLVRVVAACTAPDGTFWAVQRWVRLQPNGGWPLVRRSRPELYLSHWSGPLALLWLKWDWSYASLPQGPLDHLYGRLTYRGHPVYGFRSSRRGAPRDRFGRLVFVDTLDSPWGRGWKRVNSFLTHRPFGNFCDSIYPNRFGRHTPGRGRFYRATAVGPGVTPIVQWKGPPPGPYRPGADGNPLDYELVADHRMPYTRRVDRALNREQQRITDPSDRCYRPR
jgi:hypothetical protein